jgi:hypothetical protein
MEVENILRDIENEDLVLPEFQRNYVWKSGDVKKFFDSLYNNYPTGSLLIWKTLAPPRLRGKTKSNELVYTRVLLDGQQRLTTLYFMLKNKSPPYYEDREFNFDLYFNIETEEFRYYQKTIMDGKMEWISIRKFFEYKEVAEFIDSFPDEDTQRYYFKLKGPLMKLSKIKSYNYFVDEEKLTKIEDLKKIVEIFKLVNKQGRTLIEEDLALAHISVFWPEIKDLFRAEVNLLSSKGFKFDFNFFVMCINCVATGHAKFVSLDKVSEKKIKESWDKIRRSIEYLVNILHDRAYINSDEKYELKSGALLIPLVTYLSNNNIEFKSETQVNEFLYWFYAAMMWGRYTRRGKSAPLEQDIVSITKSNSPESLINNLKREVRDFEVKASDLKGAGITSPFFNMTFIVAKNKGAKDWFNGNRLHTRLLGDSYKLHKHHIFPKAQLEKKGYYKSQDTIKLVNELANRAFLTERANKQISSSKPKDYLPTVMQKYPSALKQQFVPTKEDLWRLDNFEDFLEDRRRRIAREINKFMNSLIKKTPSTATISELIKEDESFNLEFKSTFSYDIETKKTNKELKHSVLKTIVSFANSGGGTLLIGVSDNHKIIGLEQDYKSNWKENKDGFLLEFRKYLQNTIGLTEFNRYVDLEFHNLEGKEILEINVERALRPIYMKMNGSKVLYIRDENRNEPLTDAEEINEYVKENWD